MNFLMKILERAVEHPYIISDPEGKDGVLTKYLASMMLDYCRTVGVGMPTNFYVPPGVTAESANSHICGITVIEDERLLPGGETYEYFRTKWKGEWSENQYLIMSCTSKNGLLGIVKGYKPKPHEQLRKILESHCGGGTMEIVWGPELEFKDDNN
jgi:hypothetical protein